MFKRRESKLQSDKSRQAARRSKRQRRLTLEGLEQRQLMAAGVVPTLPSNISVPTFSGPRNVGTVQAFSFTESETTGVFGKNDFFQNADLVPLGTTAGKQATIDITGSLPFVNTSGTIVPNFISDIDTFAFDLRAGDILDISVLGAAGTIDLQFADGTSWLNTEILAGTTSYPPDSPLQTVGNAAVAQVVPEDGRYYLTVSPITTSGSYTVGLRVYRPVVESLPIGTQQIVFVDFDGAIYSRNVFNTTGVPAPGVIRLPSLRSGLPLLGIQQIDDASYNRLIDDIIAETKLQFSTLAGNGIGNGNNGNYASSGIPGEFGITVLNSRDHADPGNNPLVTRVVIGGTVTDSEINTIGISSTLDVGNFSMDDIVIALLDSVVAGVTSVPSSNTKSVLDATAKFLALLVTHEAGHSFGARHQDNASIVPSIMDSGGRFDQALGVGIDGIFGTVDDVPVDFATDIFANEGINGINFVPLGLSQTLRTGTAGGGISGRVFLDANRNGNGTGDTGFAGVSVFADLNGNGVADSAEPKAVTGADGTYTLAVAGGTFTVIATPPVNSVATTATSRTASATLGGSTTGIDFGFARVQSDVTGFVFGDNNGNGLQDNTDQPISGIYVYLDLDGDNRPDLGEPSAVSGADGSYRINFPGPGTYTIREVVPPGLIQTSPASGEHTVTFNGSVLTDNFNFGNLPSRDYGDAPDSYGTTRSAGGPSHGITTGLSLGTAVDREIDGQPTTDATGDDTNGLLTVGGALVDDEDGVRLVSPLGPGASANLEITTVNTTGGAAFLQGWMDFNNNGVFEASEKVISNRQLGSGTAIVSVNVPATAQVGNVFARFRYSQTQDLTPGGDADTGEVEDYRFTILAAAEIVNDDTFAVPRNSSMTFDVLANDFDPNNTLRVNNLNVTGTLGTVRIASDQRNVIYTPPTGFIGQDSFEYTVRNEFGVVVDSNGQPVRGKVTVNVTFQSNVPIAIDDSFVVPQGSVNRALNVLDNDIPSLNGGLTIASITPGNQGGTIRIVGGGQSLSYSPLPGFNGTEQFTYSVIDGNGNSSTAQVTVNLSPGPVPSDDQVAFSFQTLDPLNNTPITSIQAGQTFKLRVFVEDVRANFAESLKGVASAFLDVLYTDELVTTVDSDPSDDIPFDITFGQLFTPGNNTFQQSDTFSPGLLDDLGALQSNVGNPVKFVGPRELFTITMRATAAGVAIFQADPADELTSDTVVVDSDLRLTPSQLRLGRSELVIGPASSNFTSAIDDVYTITSNSGTTTSILNVQANDLIRRQELSLNPLVLGAPLDIIEFGILTGAALGNARINPGDNFISYTPNIGANGLDSFTYFIVTEDGTRSTAEVSVTVGNAGTDDLVGFNFDITDANGNVVTNPNINVGDRFGVQITVDDLRGGFSSTLVFAAFADILYDRNLISVADTSSTDRYDFDVVFGTNFDPNSGVGSAARPGIIDEFGTQDIRNSIPPGTPLEDPRVLATLFFTATAPGTTTISASPADASPNQDTLLLDRDDPVPKSQIFYDSIQITIGGAEGEFPLHNASFAQDVNADGSVSAIDALTIINAMNRQFLSQFEGEAPAATTPRSTLFLDVNGDKKVTAVDALMVINYMNSRSLSAAAEGESVVSDVLPKPSSNSLSSAELSDSAITTLTEGESEIGANAAQQSAIAQSNSSASGYSDSDEDDEDDVLSLLADDVAGVWS